MATHHDQQMMDMIYVLVLGKIRNLLQRDLRHVKRSYLLKELTLSMKLVLSSRMNRAIMFINA